MKQSQKTSEIKLLKKLLTMMPISFKQQTHVIPGGENHIDIPVYREGLRIISCWKLNKEEIEQIIKSGIIWLHVVGPIFPHLKMSGHDPFRKLRDVIVDERIVSLITQILVEDEELLLLRIKEGEHNFRVSTDDNIWYNLRYRIRGDVDHEWHSGEYSFKEEIEVVGLGTDCPEYWWILPQFGLIKENVLIIKRVKSPDERPDNS